MQATRNLPVATLTVYCMLVGTNLNCMWGAGKQGCCTYRNADQSYRGGGEVVRVPPLQPHINSVRHEAAELSQTARFSRSVLTALASSHLWAGLPDTGTSLGMLRTEPTVFCMLGRCVSLSHPSI